MAGPSDRVKETCDDHINSGDTHDRWRSATRRRGQLSRAQPGQAGRDRRPRPRRRPCPARRGGERSAAGGARVACARRRRADRRSRGGRGDGRRAADRTRRRAAVHARARQGALGGELRDRHRANDRGSARVDGGGGARPRTDRPAVALSTAAPRALRRCRPCHPVQLAARGDDDEADVGADRRQHGGRQAAADGSTRCAAVRRGVRRSAAAGCGERALGARRRARPGAGHPPGHRRHFADRWPCYRPRRDGGRGAPAHAAAAGARRQRRGDHRARHDDQRPAHRAIGGGDLHHWWTGLHGDQAVVRATRPSRRTGRGGAESLRARGRRRRPRPRGDARPAAHRRRARPG